MGIYCLKMTVELDGMLWRPVPGATFTAEEYEAEMEQRLAEVDAQVTAELAQAEQDRAERAARYDPERARARLELLGAEGVLADQVRERDGLLRRELFRATDDKRRQEHLAGLETVIAAATQAVDKLAAVMGDAETVPDERGWLPGDRRELALTLFSAQRHTEVRELRARVPARQAELKA
jgi:hypothetical protein